jgi:hypothetical protein
MAWRSSADTLGVMADEDLGVVGLLAAAALLRDRFARAEEGVVLIESPCVWQSSWIQSLLESTGTE